MGGSEASQENVGRDGNSDSSTRDLLGQRLGDFLIQRRLGSGGMGEVYLAEQVSLKRLVALKVLRADLMADENYCRRFEAEAMAVAPINHPNIVSVIAIGKESGLRWIALEYVPGMNLREYIARKGPADLAVALNVVRKIAAALDRASQEGIVHRDIKPDNVLLTKKGDVKVADFGLARQVTRDAVELTQSGMTMGTPLYMSPEQIEGKTVDIRSDIYSFGVTCYHMLTGQPPFRGETAMAVAIQHLKSTPDSLSEQRPDLPAGLNAIVEKMLAKEPADRYQTPKEILRDLAKVRNQRTAEMRAIPGNSLDTNEDIEASDEFPVLDAGGEETAEFRPPLWRRLRPTKGNSLAIAGLLLASVAGGIISWNLREPDLSQANLPNLADRIKGAAGSVRKRADGWVQLLYARSVLPEKDREAGLWAVILNYPYHEEPAIEAGQELMERYLTRGDYDSALILADQLIKRDSPKEQMFGFLFQGIIQSRRSQPDKSNESFVDMIECSKKVTLEPTQLQWLARQYFLALDLNTKLLGQTAPPEDLIRRFRENFLKGNGGVGRPG
ncbi:MAG: protein kinase [Planctomycetota bacterium]